MSEPQPDRPLSRKVPLLTWDEAARIERIEDIPGIVVSRPDRRWIDVSDGTEISSPSVAGSSGNLHDHESAKSR